LPGKVPHEAAYDLEEHRLYYGIIKDGRLPKRGEVYTYNHHPFFYQSTAALEKIVKNDKIAMRLTWFLEAILIFVASLVFAKTLDNLVPRPLRNSLFLFVVTALPALYMPFSWNQDPLVYGFLLIALSWIARIDAGEITVKDAVSIGFMMGAGLLYKITALPPGILIFCLILYLCAKGRPMRLRQFKPALAYVLVVALFALPNILNGRIQENLWWVRQYNELMYRGERLNSDYPIRQFLLINPKVLWDGKLTPGDIPGELSVTTNILTSFSQASSGRPALKSPPWANLAGLWIWISICYVITRYVWNRRKNWLLAVKNDPVATGLMILGISGIGQLFYYSARAPLYWIGHFEYIAYATPALILALARWLGREGPALLAWKLTVSFAALNLWIFTYRVALLTSNNQ
jgi:hypothetical protein